MKIKREKRKATIVFKKYLVIQILVFTNEGREFPKLSFVTLPCLKFPSQQWTSYRRKRSDCTCLTYCTVHTYFHTRNTHFTFCSSLGFVTLYIKWSWLFTSKKLISIMHRILIETWQLRTWEMLFVLTRKHVSLVHLISLTRH